MRDPALQRAQAIEPLRAEKLRLQHLVSVMSVLMSNRTRLLRPLIARERPATIHDRRGPSLRACRISLRHSPFSSSPLMHCSTRPSRSESSCTFFPTASSGVHRRVHGAWFQQQSPLEVAHDDRVGPEVEQFREFAFSSSASYCAVRSMIVASTARRD